MSSVQGSGRIRRPQWRSLVEVVRGPALDLLGHEEVIRAAVVDPNFLGLLVTAASQISDAGLASPQIIHLGNREPVWYQGGGIR